MMGSSSEAIDVAEAGRPLAADLGVQDRPIPAEAQKIIPQLAGGGVVEESIEGDEKHAPFRHRRDLLRTSLRARDRASLQDADRVDPQIRHG